MDWPHHTRPYSVTIMQLHSKCATTISAVDGKKMLTYHYSAASGLDTHNTCALRSRQTALRLPTASSLPPPCLRRNVLLTWWLLVALTWDSLCLRALPRSALGCGDCHGRPIQKIHPRHSMASRQGRAQQPDASERRRGEPALPHLPGDGLLGVPGCAGEECQLADGPVAVGIPGCRELSRTEIEPFEPRARRWARPRGASPPLPGDDPRARDNQQPCGWLLFDQYY